MPKAARAHTSEGAKAFVVYYWKAVDYSQQTLDTKPVELISDPNCVACQAGIKALQEFARQHGRLLGGTEVVSSLKVLSIKSGYPVVVSFELVSAAQQVVVPGKTTVVHPAGTNRKIMTLIPRDNGWVAGELRSGQ